MDPNEITTVFQPIVDLRTLEIVGHEALLRHPRIPPQRLFADAETQNSAIALDFLVVKKACDAAASWLPPNLRLFLNLSPRTVSAVAAGAVERIDTGALAPTTVVWELPERHGWPVDPYAVANIRRALSPGLLALDDVGEGHAELTRLARLRPEWIKVSAALVRKNGGDTCHRPALAAVVKLAEEIGSKVIAEGIESAEEAEECFGCGIEYGQGYFFAKPAATPIFGIQSGGVR